MKGNASGKGQLWKRALANSEDIQMTEEGRQLAKDLKALHSLATEDAVQTV